MSLAGEGTGIALSLLGPIIASEVRGMEGRAPVGSEAFYLALPVARPFQVRRRASISPCIR